MSRQTRGKKAMEATGIRMMLAGVLAIILIAMAGGFYMAYGALKTTASGVSDIQTQASSSNAELQRLSALKKDLETYQDVVKKTASIVSESQMYQYQNQIINDMTAMAQSAGVNITGFYFNVDDENDQAGGTTEAPPAAPAVSNAAGEEGMAAETPVAAEPATTINSTTVSITVQRGTRYDNLLRLIYLIENNVARMQIAQLSLLSGPAGTVTVEALDVEVYIR